MKCPHQAIASRHFRRQQLAEADLRLVCVRRFGSCLMTLKTELREHGAHVIVAVLGLDDGILESPPAAIAHTSIFWVSARKWLWRCSRDACHRSIDRIRVRRTAPTIDAADEMRHIQFALNYNFWQGSGRLGQKNETAQEEASMTYVCSRRQWLISLIPAVACSRWALAGARQKPMRGIFIIMATPYTAAKQVDYEDLAREVDFLDRCKVHGMVWPQLASEYSRLTKEERLQGMKVLARAAAGKKPALVLGVQGRNTAEALEYLQCAEEASPDAVIAIPPTEAKSLDDFRGYYTTLARKTKLPFFVQTTGGAPNIEPTVEFLVELAREFPHCGYVKEEFNPVIDRMKALAAHRPTIKGVFSGQAGRGMMYEMRLGFDGTMPGAPYADMYSQIWNFYQSGQEEKARELFGRLLLMINLEQQIQGTRQYVMHKRGVFKTTMSRQQEFHWTAEAKKEIDVTWEALKPYLID